MFKNLGVYAKGAVLLAAAANAQAVTVSGSTVDFTFDDSLLGLFGNYSVVGDTLKFDPTDFSVDANPGNTADIIAATAPEITVTAKGSGSLGHVSVSEKGSYSLIGNGDAHVLGTIDVNGEARAVDQTFSSFDEKINSPWSLTETFGSIGGSSTTVKIDNVLAALIFDDTSLARISKTGVSVNASVVPLPAAVWMLGSALVGMIGVARRKLA